MKLSEWLTANTIEASPKDFVEKRDYIEQRKKLITGILADQTILPGYDPDGINADSDVFAIQRSFLRYFEEASAENRDKVEAWLKLNELGRVTMYEFLNMASYEEARSKAVKSLKLESENQ